MKRKEADEILKAYGLAPNKALGQNFLTDESLTRKIIDIVSPMKGDKLLEIGPGLGALTNGLAALASVTAVEIDLGVYNYLRKVFDDNKNVSLIHGDFLKFEQHDIWTKVVSNLPYYCASEILFKIAETCKDADVFVMLQKEMAERIWASPGTKSYGAFTITLGYYYNVGRRFNVPRESFFPRPDVASVFIELKRRPPVLSFDENRMFHLLVKSAFWGRRKTLYRALAESPHINVLPEHIKAGLAGADIDAGSRGEELSGEIFYRLAKTFIEIQNEQTKGR